MGHDQEGISFPMNDHQTKPRRKNNLRTDPEKEALKEKYRRMLQPVTYRLFTEPRLRLWEQMRRRSK